MGMLTRSLFWSLIVALFVGFSLLRSDQHPNVEILVEQIKRVSRDEVHFRLKVRNRSDRSIFLTAITCQLSGIKKESRARLYPIHLEQWRRTQGWTTTSCTDTPPPHVKELNPGEVIADELWAKLPMSAVCKNRIARWEGRFRFRVEYFDSEKQARTYVKMMFSERWREARAAVALSEPFEIPPPPSPKL